VLFDLRPKSSRRELFDRERELGVLDGAASRGDPLVLVLGIKRIGKTSLLKAFLENWSGIYVDMRGVRCLADLYREIARGISSGLDKLRRLLEGIRGISIAGVEVEIRWRGRDSISLLGLLQELDRKGERIVVVFDEVQVVRPPIATEIRNAIAYAYDHLRNVTVILSGSEIGLLRDFVGIENPESPLFGRYALELRVERFPRDLSIEFLERGFRELGVSVSRDVIERGVELFDGIVGWLVFFGRAYVDGVRDLSRVMDLAVNLALEELDKLGRREKLVLKAIASGARSWSEVRRFVEEREGVSIPKSTLTRIIRKLERLSIVENYRFLDPVYREAAKRLKP